MVKHFVPRPALPPQQDLFLSLHVIPPSAITPTTTC